MRATGHSFELVSSDASGQDQRVITGGGKQTRPLPNPFSAPAWSSDGATVVFAGLSRWSDGKPAIYRIGADGAGLRKLPGTKGGFKPVLSPDGRSVAFAVFRQRTAPGPKGRERVVFDGASTWLLDLTRGSTKRITPWRNRLYEYPSSFSPDGTTLGISLTELSGRHSRRSAVAIRLDGSGSRVLAEDAANPVYSPDGSRIALLLLGKPRTYKGPNHFAATITPSDLAVAAADGSGVTRLTHTAGLEQQPSWDPSGQRIAYTEQRASGREADYIGIGDSIMEINADGSCRTRLLSYAGVILYGGTWQPGPGREAGPISC